ncbi:hypothetical protein [Citricoccus sp.]|nr:hypothetical protein [Citricoccus sp.]
MIINWQRPVRLEGAGWFGCSHECRQVLDEGPDSGSGAGGR